MLKAIIVTSKQRKLVEEEPEQKKTVLSEEVQKIGKDVRKPMWSVLSLVTTLAALYKGFYALLFSGSIAWNDATWSALLTASTIVLHFLLEAETCPKVERFSGVLYVSLIFLLNAGTLVIENDYIYFSACTTATIMSFLISCVQKTYRLTGIGQAITFVSRCIQLPHRLEGVKAPAEDFWLWWCVWYEVVWLAGSIKVLQWFDDFATGKLKLTSFAGEGQPPQGQQQQPGQEQALQQGPQQTLRPAAQPT
eukprot:TRINITY_DN82448_c0_g1_i1.p1 TRINITY_DN82448_c0_g1~~TRINITY_DN82448_c0_g1_i1.p1  ORF type:complete len:250 (-),score=44.41 TRINITY_DN82448_c0_g1_i1:349-1098(-)